MTLPTQAGAWQGNMSWFDPPARLQWLVPSVVRHKAGHTAELQLCNHLPNELLKLCSHHSAFFTGR